MYLTSPAFINNELIPKEYTCDSEGLHPALQISAPPIGTKSFALTMTDPDSPSGTWTHWLVWNIDPSTSFINDGEVPPGSIEGKNGSDKVGWYPPCPHTGTHRYIFTLYALGSMLELAVGASREELENTLKPHLLGSAVLTRKYAR